MYRVTTGALSRKKKKLTRTRIASLVSQLYRFPARPSFNSCPYPICPGPSPARAALLPPYVMTIHLCKWQGRASSHVNLRISNWAPFSSSIWTIFVIALKCCLMQRRPSDPSLNVARPLLFLAVSWLFWLFLILLHHTIIDPLHPDLQILCWLLLLAASGLFWQKKQMLRETMASIPFYVQLLYRPRFLAKSWLFQYNYSVPPDATT